MCVLMMAVRCSGFDSDIQGFCFLEAKTTNQKTNEQFFARHFWRSGDEDMIILCVTLMLAECTLPSFGSDCYRLRIVTTGVLNFHPNE